MFRWLRLLIVGSFLLGFGLIYGVARFSRYIRHDPHVVAIADAQEKLDTAEAAAADEEDAVDDRLDRLRVESDRKVGELETRIGLHAAYRPEDPKSVKDEIQGVINAIAFAKRENAKVIDHLQDEEDDRYDEDNGFKP